jgi:hypothetical protein
MLSRLKYKKGHQTVVYNTTSGKYQVQTWTGKRWYGFVSVNFGDVHKEKTRQLKIVIREDKTL